MELIEFNEKDNNGNTFIIDSILRNKDIQNYINEKNIRDRNNYCDRVIHVAIEMSNFKLVNYIIQYVLDNKIFEVFEDLNGFGESCLHLCVKHNINNKILESFLKYKLIDLDIKEQRNGDTALIVAAKHCNEDAIKLLLKYKADDKLKNKEDYDVYHYIQKYYLNIN